MTSGTTTTPCAIIARQGQDMYINSWAVAAILLCHSCMLAAACVQLGASECAGAGTDLFRHQLVATNRLTVADMCSTVPEWCWFGLSLLLIVIGAVPSSHSSILPLPNRGDDLAHAPTGEHVFNYL
jgi:hypothetical protein